MAKQEKLARVRVFRNLHFKDRVVWSVQHKVKGSWLLLFHTPNVMLRSAEFIVSAAGREKVRREKRKTVHAFVEGDLVVDPNWFSHWKELESRGVRVTYNPYKYESFVVHPQEAEQRSGIFGEQPVESAQMVWMNDRGGVHTAVPRGPGNQLLRSVLDAA